MSEENVETNGNAEALDNIAKQEDFGASPAEKFKANADRIAEQKARSASVIDSIWDNVEGDAKTLKEAGSESKKAEEPSNEQAKQRNSDFTDGDEGAETAERTFKDVTDEVWDSARGESETEEDAEADSQESEESDELAEGEELEASDEELEESGESRDDIIIATVEGEDGAESIEIPKDAKITVKVDGEEQEISIQEFANGISGQKAIAQKFSALNGEQKAFESRLQNWNDTSAKAAELMKENKAVEAIEHVAQMMGHDPQLLFTSLFEEITPVLNQYADLSQQERDVWVQDLKNKKAEFQARSAQEELSKLQAAQEQQTRVRSVQEAYGLDEATFTHAYHALEAEMEAGSMQKQPITPELVGQYSVLVTFEGYAEEALKGTAHEGDKGAVNQILQVVSQLAQAGQEVTAQTVKDIVSEALGREKQIEKSKSVNKSLKKKGVKPKAKDGKKPAKQVNRKDPTDRPKHWMERALDELESGSSAADLGLLSNKNKRK